MSKYDLIAFDMDGTLLNSQKEISQDSLVAIEKALAAGKVVTLSTGRPIPETREFEEQLKNLPYYICNSGALIIDRKTNQPIYEKYLSEEDVLKIFELTDGYDLMYHHLADKSYMQKNHFDNLATYNMSVYTKNYTDNGTIVEDLPSLYNAELYKVYKFNLYCKNEADRNSLKEKLSKLNINVSYAERTAIECSPIGVTKGNALRRLCDYLNIPIERSIAVGDADNDIDILQTAGLGAGMGNCNENVRAIADVILKDCDNGGCAQVIEEYLLK